MYTLSETTTLVPFSELRTKLDEVLKALKTSKVVLERRKRPFAVLVPIEKFEKMEELLEMVEDRTLGYIAQERDKKGKEKDYLSLDEAEKKVGLKK
ncbi:MAG: type II toxin-antitoxin system Phd/YefM family antitoxin [Deltaproteobacteria bacterium]|nr:type II toxin-antitoxin system Phd/YefM family antitoxin [Deltaproteobacteria bacterium]